MTKHTLATTALPGSLQQQLTRIGGNIRLARQRRGYTQETLARLAYVSRATIARLERGDPGVSLGVLAQVLLVLNLEHTLDAIAAPADDVQGELQERRRTRRVRPPRDDHYDF